METRNLTEYLARAILETREQRDHRHSINLAAHEHQARLVSDFERAKDYYAATHELASEANEREPKFTEKEKINLEIYAEKQDDALTRETYLELAREQTQDERQQELAASQTR